MAGAVDDGTRPTHRLGPVERRARALDAFIDLVLEAGEFPRPEDVADRAGVSIASLYRYFATLEELQRDAVVRVTDRFAELFSIPDIGTGTRAERIGRFAESRVALHERLHPLQQLSRSRSRTEPVAAELVDGARQAAADQIRLHFDAELAPLATASRADAVAGIAVLTSVESWEQYRRTHGRSPAQTRRAWIDAIDRLLPQPTATA